MFGESSQFFFLEVEHTWKLHNKFWGIAQKPVQFSSTIIIPHSGPFNEWKILLKTQYTIHWVSILFAFSGGTVIRALSGLWSILLVL